MHIDESNLNWLSQCRGLLGAVENQRSRSLSGSEELKDGAATSEWIMISDKILTSGRWTPGN